MVKRITHEGLRRLVRLEARRLVNEGPGPMRSQARGRHHGEGSRAMNARPDPTAERQDRVDDLTLDPRMVELHRKAEAIMADGYSVDDIIAALVSMADPDPGRPL